MSVINNVLKELENKPSSFTPLAASGIVIESPQQDKNSFIWIGIFVLFVLILFTGYILNSGLFEFSGRDVSINKDDVMPLESLPVNHLAAPDFPQSGKEHIQITGLQVNETVEYMQLAFQLEHRAQTFLQSRSGNKYVFHLKNARSSIVAPQLGANPWLYNINLNNANDGLEIQFETRQDVLVETGNLQEQQQAIWLIKFKRIPSSTTEKVSVSEPKKVQINTQQQDQKKLPAVIVSQSEEESNIIPSPVKLDIKSTSKKSTQLQVFNEATSALNSARWSKAELLFNKLIGSEYDRQVRLHLLQLYKQQQQTQLLEKLILESQKEYPDDSAFNLFHANELFADKRYVELIRLYALKANTIQLINLLAASYQRTDQHNKATQHYMQAIEMDSRQSKLWISLGISQQQLGHKTAALKSYQTALRNGLNNERLKAFLQQRIRQLSDK